MKAVFLILAFLLNLAPLLAQTSSSKKAVKIYNSAKVKFASAEYKQALPELDKALQLDANFLEALLLKAQSHQFLGQSVEAISAYSKLTAQNPNFFTPALYHLAALQFSEGRYAEAAETIDKFLSSPNPTKSLIEKANKIRQSADFALKSIAAPSLQEPPQVLPLDMEEEVYYPRMSLDNQKLIFTALLPIDPSREATAYNIQEDLFEARWEDSAFTTPAALPFPINTEQNEGAHSISADGRTLFFTMCNHEDGFGGCDIYYSNLIGERWTAPKNLGPVINSKYKETQPCISADGRSLYFVSNRPGGKGNQDIYVSHLSSDNRWLAPVNLSCINTPQNEATPFIHADGQTLYFSSDGYLGMGGYDIFVSHKLADKEDAWSAPQNLGFPINTHRDEEGLVVSHEGLRSVFSSNQTANKRRIYAFEMPNTLRPKHTAYLKASVYDAATHTPLAANLDIIDLDSNQRLSTFAANNPIGEALIPLPVERNFLISVAKKGYLFDNRSLLLSEDAQENVIVEIPLQKIKTGTEIVLKNLYFALNSAEILEHSFVELELLFKLLETNPQLRIKISGHADSSGTKDYNLKLSAARADALKKYLINKGIASARIETIGLGDSQPISDNPALNRRITMEILP